MNINYIVTLPILIPLFTGAFLLLYKKPSEKFISTIYSFSCNLTFALSVAIGLLLMGNRIPSDINLGSLYSDGHYKFNVYFLLDKFSVLYALLASVLALVTAKYSRYYMHRESGYKRYFILTSVLLSGAITMAYAGSLDVFFIGWELIGVSSFLLIGFYWYRNQPAKNAFIVFVIYRICDLGLLMGTMLGHVLWEGGDRFYSLVQNGEILLAGVSQEHAMIITFMSFLVILAAVGKSAQFPFMNWLPRAFEGPTPSSAIFYGALSIHAGLLLLYRTEPLWRHSTVTVALLCAIGLVSAVLATLIGRTVANIKSQLAYAAITQVGIMLVELALGLYTLMLFHMVLHAITRCYQILVSPSVVAHKMRILALTIRPKEAVYRPLLKYPEQLFLGLEKKLYGLTLLDFYLWPSVAALVPFRRLNSSKKFVNSLISSSYFVFIGWLVFLGMNAILHMEDNVVLTVSLISALLIAGSTLFGRQINSHYWNRVMLYLVVSAYIYYITLREQYYFSFVLYVAIVFACWASGYLANIGLKRVTMNKYNGLLRTNRVSAYVSLFAVLVLVGTPLSPLFVLEDLMLHELFISSQFNAVLSVFGFTLLSISLGKNYTRTFWGQ